MNIGDFSNWHAWRGLPKSQLMRKFEFLEVKSVVGFCKDNLLITVNMPEMQRFCLSCFGLKTVYNKQLLDDAEYDMKNDAD